MKKDLSEITIYSCINDDEDCIRYAAVPFDGSIACGSGLPLDVIYEFPVGATALEYDEPDEIYPSCRSYIYHTPGRYDEVEKEYLRDLSMTESEVATLTTLQILAESVATIK